jgi:general secretion pathway protein J
MKCSRSSESGMTLIETLVALFVIALMASAGAVMTNQTLRGARVLEDRGAASGELAAALNIISSDLAAYTGRKSQDAAQSEPAAAFAGYPPRADGRLMVFVRNGWSNPLETARSDLQRVEYRFEGGALIRRSWQAPDPGAATPAIEEILLSGLEGVEAGYGRSETWRSEWMSEGGEALESPQKVELKLVFSEEDILTVRYLLGAGS